MNMQNVIFIRIVTKNTHLEVKINIWMWKHTRGTDKSRESKRAFESEQLNVETHSVVLAINNFTVYTKAMLNSI